MAKDKIVLAELDIDAKALMKSAMDIKKNLDELAEKQAKLTEKGKESSAQFISNEASIRSLEAAYKSQVTTLSAYSNEEGKILSRKKAIKDAVKEVNDTENDYISNNEELIALKKQLNSNDDNYEKQLVKINAKLQENNSWLQQNGTEHGKLKVTLNDFGQQIAGSLASINIFNGGLGGMMARAQEAGGMGPLFTNAFNGISGGIKGMGAALAANPIGAILQLLLPVIQGIFNAFKTFTPIVEKVEQVMAGVGAVFESVKNSVIGLLTGATSLGDFFSGFAGSAADAASEAMKLEEAQQKLTKQMELQEIANEESKNSIDKLIAQSKDQTLSEEQRADALKKAAKTEQDTHDQNKKLADAAYSASLKKIAVGKNLTDEEIKRLEKEGYAYAKQLADKKGIEKEELDALKDSYKKKLQIERDGIALSQKMKDAEHGANAQRMAEAEKKKDDALKREQERRQKQGQMLDDYAVKLQLELELFLQQEGEKTRTLEEELRFAEQVHKRKLDIAKAEYQASEKTSNDRLKLKLAEGAANIDHIDQAQEATARYAAAQQESLKNELEAYLEKNESVLKNEKVLTQALIGQEAARLEEIKRQKLKILEDETDTNDKIIKIKQEHNQALTAEDNRYLAEKAVLEAEYQTQTEANTAALETQSKLQKAEQAKADRELALTDAEMKHEEDKLLEQERYAAEQEELKARLDQDFLTQEQYDALSEEAKKNHTDREKALDRSVQENKMQIASQTFGNLTKILGENSAAGKAMAIAQTTIDTYMGAQKAYTSQLVTGDPSSPIRAAIAAGAAVATGLANVKKITSTKTPKAEKGALFSIGGNRHSAGGTLFTGADGTRFEAERGELIGVMNRNAAAHFMAFNNAFPAGGTAAPGYFANGGIVSREIAQQTMNMDELAQKIAAANQTLPHPVVAVQDIITHGSSYVQVRDGANF